MTQGAAGDRPAGPSRGAEPGAGGDHPTDLPQRIERIERLDLIRYAGASGDFNVIHWSDEAARSVGLPGVIAHGMYSLGVAARLVTAYAKDPRAIRSIRARFSATIQPGQELVVKGRVAAAADGAEEIAFWAEDEAGNKVISRGAARLGPAS